MSQMTQKPSFCLQIQQTASLSWVFFCYLFLVSLHHDLSGFSAMVRFVQSLVQTVHGCVSVIMYSLRYLYMSTFGDSDTSYSFSFEHKMVAPDVSMLYEGELQIS